MRNQAVSQHTENRYKEAYDDFRRFHQLLPCVAMLTFEIFDEMVGEIIEELWQSGATKSSANYTLAAIQYFRPQTKTRMPIVMEVSESLKPGGSALEGHTLVDSAINGFCGDRFSLGPAHRCTFADSCLSSFLENGGTASSSM